MNNEEKTGKLTKKEYQELFGVKKATFEEMLKILERNYQERHTKGGRKPKLSVLDKRIIMLQYYRVYRAMKHIMLNYGAAKSTICDSIAWVEETLSKSGRFRLPSKRKLVGKDVEWEIVIVDAAECEIERPENNRTAITPERRKGIH